MIRQDLKELKTGSRELRKFGLLVGGIFAALGILWWLRGKAWYPWSLIPGVLLLGFGAVAPRLLKPVYIAWMSVAIVMGFLISNVILTLLFFLVITPIGLVSRMSGKDFLGLKLERQRATYWIPRKQTGPKSKADYEQQF